MMMMMNEMNNSFLLSAWILSFSTFDERKKMLYVQACCFLFYIFTFSFSSLPFSFLREKRMHVLSPYERRREHHHHHHHTVDISYWSFFKIKWRRNNRMRKDFTSNRLKISLWFFFSCKYVNYVSKFESISL